MTEDLFWMIYLSFHMFFVTYHICGCFCESISSLTMIQFTILRIIQFIAGYTGLVMAFVWFIIVYSRGMPSEWIPEAPSYD